MSLSPATRLGPYEILAATMWLVLAFVFLRAAAEKVGRALAARR